MEYVTNHSFLSNKIEFQTCTKKVEEFLKNGRELDNKIDYKKYPQKVQGQHHPNEEVPFSIYQKYPWRNSKARGLHAQDMIGFDIVETGSITELSIRCKLPLFEDFCGTVEEDDLDFRKSKRFLFDELTIYEEVFENCSEIFRYGGGRDLCLMPDVDDFFSDEYKRIEQRVSKLNFEYMRTKNIFLNKVLVPKDFPGKLEQPSVQSIWESILCWY